MRRRSNAYFLIITIFLLLAIISCNDNRKSTASNDSLEKIGRVIAATSDTTLLPQLRIKHSDSAIELASSASDETVVGYTYSVKQALLQQFYPDSVIPFLKRFRQISAVKKDTFNIAFANGLIADYYLQNDRADSAFYYYNRAKQLHESRKDSLHVVYSLLQLAEIHRRFNDYAALEDNSVEARRMLNNPRDTLYNPTIYNNFGIASKNLFAYDDAINYYNIAANTSRDSISKIIALGNVAAVQKMSGNYSSAARLLEPLLKSKLVANNHQIKGRFLGLLGHIKIKSQQRGSIALLSESETARKKAGDSVGLAVTYMYFSEAYQNENRPVALRYATKAYRLATQQNSIDDRLDALQEIIKNSDAANAKNAMLLFMRLGDSIQLVRQKAKNTFAKLKYDASVERDENLTLRADRAEKALMIQKASYQNQMLIGGILLLLSIGTTIYIIVKKKHKREKDREAYVTETRIGKKVHDELANDVYQTIAFTETENLALDSKKETLLQYLENIYMRSRDISRENSTIAEGADFNLQLREMLSGYTTSERNVIVQGIDDIPWMAVGESKRIATHRILQELMVNMKKHSCATLALIRFETDGAKVGINYSDNGIGMSAPQTIIKNGLHNVENRIHAIGGTITFGAGPEKGTRIHLTFKLKK